MPFQGDFDKKIFFNRAFLKKCDDLIYVFDSDCVWRIQSMIISG